MPAGRTHERVRVLRIIARMNVGGPALHVSSLADRLDPERYETRLVTGTIGRGEASLDHLAERASGGHLRIASLGPELSPPRDLAALRELVREVRRFRPDIVHTHTAKAGALGRLAAVAGARRRSRPIIVHTYHGHVLKGYFGPLKTGVFRALERRLAPFSDALIGVSRATVEELVALRVAPPERFTVIPLGLDLERFTRAVEADGRALRAELGLESEAFVATFVGRLVPIKRVDVLLHAVALARPAVPHLRLLVVGDGELRAELEARCVSLGITDLVRFLGYREDLPEIAAATDVAVLSSDNEGTPVALIEAAATGRPAVATDVGGVADIVGGATGRLVPPGDPAPFAKALEELAADAGLRARLGAAAREHVLGRYGVDRLVSDVERLYGTLLERRGG